ncbi:rod-binding protein [Tateyamaria sp. SN6-1]|uniref:rod-binding protein n=1 Tax=Tateyamaria sp. SN6-1 TaxID=3092148 RepID=UPI0039F55179
MELSPMSRPVSPALPPQDAKLMRVAQELEASFLAEMLKSAGYGEAREAFGGGAGEEQFASFLVDEQAKEIVRAGGIGLAEHLFESLKAQSHE